ncbi:hypothetical protein B0H16DRAFT_1729501 [Mycena metata]|uniref:Uncharacterized protein n=1 Tax=Mycena metata TaxID=1033252 RepID=A0AAD7N0W2_9AGAR|nr:hypothetical protein B0H16DRAFT_1729501 [Mycena metata]
MSSRLLSGCQTHRVRVRVRSVSGRGRAIHRCVVVHTGTERSGKLSGGRSGLLANGKARWPPLLDVIEMPAPWAVGVEDLDLDIKVLIEVLEVMEQPVACRSVTPSPRSKAPPPCPSPTPSSASSPPSPAPSPLPPTTKATPKSPTKGKFATAASDDEVDSDEGSDAYDGYFSDADYALPGALHAHSASAAAAKKRVTARIQHDFLEVMLSSYRPGLIPFTSGTWDPAGDFAISVSAPTVRLVETIPAQALVAWDRRLLGMGLTRARGHRCMMCIRR